MGVVTTRGAVEIESPWAMSLWVLFISSFVTREAGVMNFLEVCSYVNRGPYFCIASSIFLIDDCYWRALSIKTGGAATGQVILGGRRKVTERDTGKKSNKQHCSMVSTSVPASNFLSWVSKLTSLSNGRFPGTRKPNKPFPPQVSFVHVVCHSTAVEHNRYSVNTEPGRKMGLNNQNIISGFIFHLFMCVYPSVCLYIM